MKKIIFISHLLVIVLISCRKSETAIGGSETLKVIAIMPDSADYNKSHPVKGAVVDLFYSDKKISEVSQTTDTKGECTFKYLKPGKYILKTEQDRKEGEYTVKYKVEKEITIIEGVEGDEVLLLKPEAPSRSGLLFIHSVSETGTPLDQVSICLFSTEQEFDSAPACTSESKTSEGKTPGLILFNGLKSGHTYYIKARRQSENIILLGELIFNYSDTGNDVHQYITLKPDMVNKEGRIEIKLVNEQGIPQEPNSLCMFTSKEELLDSSFQCNSTNKVFTGLVSGKTYYFKANRKSGSLLYEAIDSVIFQPTLKEHTIILKLRSTSEENDLTIQVFAPSGAPQPLATICVLYSREELNDTLNCSGAQTGPDGNLKLMNLVSGYFYYIKAYRMSGNYTYEAKDSLIYTPGMTKSLHLRVK